MCVVFIERHLMSIINDLSILKNSCWTLCYLWQLVRLFSEPVSAGVILCRRHVPFPSKKIYSLIHIVTSATVLLYSRTVRMFVYPPLPPPPSPLLSKIILSPVNIFTYALKTYEIFTLFAKFVFLLLSPSFSHFLYCFTFGTLLDFPVLFLYPSLFLSICQPPI